MFSSYLHLLRRENTSVKMDIERAVLWIHQLYVSYRSTHAECRIHNHYRWTFTNRKLFMTIIETRQFYPIRVYNALVRTMHCQLDTYDTARIQRSSPSHFIDTIHWEGSKQGHNFWMSIRQSMRDDNR